MPDPERLLMAQGTSDFEKKLLDSWQAQGPSDEARRNVLAIASVGAAASVASGVAAATSSSLAPKAATAGLAMVVKWLGLGLVAVALLGAGLATRPSSRVAGPPQMVLVPHASIAPALAAPTDSETFLAEHAEPSPSLFPTAQQGPTPPPSHVISRGGPHPTPSLPSSSRLAGEVTSLERVRQALVGGRAADALALLESYRREFPGGVLAQEADVLRVEALEAKGDHAAAARLGDRFLAHYPDSPHAARLRAVLGATR